MRRKTLFVVLVLAAFQLRLVAQDTLPADTAVPVALTSTLTSDSHPGQAVYAKVMQDITIRSNVVVSAGAKVVGHVVDTKPAAEGGPQIAFRFDRILTKNTLPPSDFALRAIASPVEVHDAQVCKTGPDEGISAFSWTTVQVGGNVAYGCGGPVLAGAREIGRLTHQGALAPLMAKPGSECSAGSQDSTRLQALWVFSSDACGVYGLDDLQIPSYGRTAPLGEIVLRSPGKSVNIPKGTGLLLQVIGQSRP